MVDPAEGGLHVEGEEEEEQRQGQGSQKRWQKEGQEEGGVANLKKINEPQLYRRV